MTLGFFMQWIFPAIVAFIVQMIANYLDGRFDG